MEIIKQYKGLAAVALLLVALITVSALGSDASNTNASEESSESSEQQVEEPTESDATDRDRSAEEAEETNETTDTETTESNSSYEYVAQPGDSHSVLARKAVQTYGIINDVSLSQAEIIAAETKLTMDAQAGYLEIGQDVSFDIDTVKAAMDHAQALSDEEKAAWATYIPYVEFDTRNYGE